MRKELRFISSCFNINYQIESKKIIENLLNKNLDWDFILKKIIQSDIAPLAFYNLSGFKNTEIPAWFLENLKNRRDSAIVKNLFLYREADRLIDLLTRVNISAIALKGAFMSDIIYQNIDVRPLSDIDILIKKSDLEKTEAMMQKNSYIKIGGDLAAMQYIPDHGQSKTLIELHHALNIPNDISLPEDFMWSRAEKKEKSPAGMLYPSIEDSIIYAALHFFHHISEAFLLYAALPSLKSILDIHEIISKKQNEIDWNYIVEFSKKYKIRYILYLSLSLSKTYFKTPVKAGIINELKPPFVRRYAMRMFIIRKYLSVRPGNRYTETFRFVYYSLLEKPYLKQRIFKTVNTFAKEYNLPYPSVKTYFLYIIRPVLALFYFKKCS